MNRIAQYTLQKPSKEVPPSVGCPPPPSAVFKGGLKALAVASSGDSILALAETEAPVLLAGTWNGHPLDEAALREMVETYNPDAQPAPLKLTHKDAQGPALGWVKALRLGTYTPPGQRRPRTTLFARLEPTDLAREKVRCGEFRLKSIEAWPRGHPSNPTPGKWHFKALALLGSDSPGCPNLGPLELSEAPEIETPVLALDLNHSDGDTPSHPHGAGMTPEEQAALEKKAAALEAQSKDLETQKRELEARLAAKEREVQAGLVQARLDGLVKDAKLTPAQATLAKPVLLSLPVEGEVHLAEGKKATPREALFSLLEGLQGHGLGRALPVPHTAAAELAAQGGDKAKAMDALVAKHKAAGKSHDEAVSLAAGELEHD